MTPTIDPLLNPTRRAVLASLGALALAGCGGGQSAPPVTPSALPLPGANSLRVSRQGSNRGTAYQQGNKVLSLPEGGRLITYLESDGSQVVVILEQLDRQLTSVRRMAVGLAKNNHGGASMAIDSQQHLHIVYGPHGGPMQYRRSQDPSAWFDLGSEQTFGSLLTYPSLVIDAQDRLFVAAREGSGEQGAKGTLEIWATDGQGVFQHVATPLINREYGYAAFNPSLHIDPKGRLHLIATIHEGTDDQLYGRYQAITYLSSDDAGATWKNARQAMLSLPARVTESGTIYEGGMSVNEIVSGGVVTTDTDGRVLAHFHIELVDQNRSSLMLARLEDGVWQLDDMRQLCDVPDGHEFCDSGVMCIDGSSVIFASVMQCVRPEDRSPFHGAAWGHTSNRVAIGRFDLSGRSGRFQLLAADGNLQGPYWFPNFQRPTRQGEGVSAPDTVIYTRGDPEGGYLAGGRDVYVQRFS